MTGDFSISLQLKYLRINEIKVNYTRNPFKRGLTSFSSVGVMSHFTYPQFTELLNWEFNINILKAIESKIKGSEIKQVAKM